MSSTISSSAAISHASFAKASACSPSPLRPRRRSSSAYSALAWASDGRAPMRWFISSACSKCASALSNSPSVAANIPTRRLVEAEVSGDQRDARQPRLFIWLLVDETLDDRHHLRQPALLAADRKHLDAIDAFDRVADSQMPSVDTVGRETGGTVDAQWGVRLLARERRQFVRPSSPSQQEI